MSLIKCNKCGEKYPKEQMEYTGKTTKYCPNCITNVKEMKVFRDNICQLFGTVKPSIFIIKKATEYVEKGMTYSQIWFVMDYMLRVEGKQLREDIILLVPSFYDATRRLYEVKDRFNRSLANTTKLPEQQVDISEVNIIRPNLNNTSYIDISKL